MIFCDYCDEGNRQEQGWHYFVDEALSESYRLPCAIWPPAIETVGGP